jgi:hypothetical protein
MKQGDIVTIFGNPLGLKNPMGQAKLVNPIQKFTSIEIWEVEFTNYEGMLFKKLIRNLNYKKTDLILEYERIEKERNQHDG